MDNDLPETERAQIYGGPLDGLDLAITKGKKEQPIGSTVKRAVIDGMNCEVYYPGLRDVKTYTRIDTETRDGRILLAAPGYNSPFAA